MRVAHRDPAGAPPPERVDAPVRSAAGMVLGLQRLAGNRAVASLLREVKTKPKVPAAATVSLRVVPDRALTGPEFSVLVSAQLHGISEREARARQDDLKGSDHHFTTGVRAAEVGKP